MKTFKELFIDARAVSTPFVAVRTFDPTSTIGNVKAAIDAQHAIEDKYPDAANTAILVWDSMHGLRGLGENGNPGSRAFQSMMQIAGLPDSNATRDLPTAISLLEFAASGLIVFVHNPQLVWGTELNVIQATCNQRDNNKANGNMLVFLLGVGDELPRELQQDVLVLEEPLPTREELAAAIVDTYKCAAQNPKYAACKAGPDEKTLKDSGDALLGLPFFPADQAAAMNLDKMTGTMDIPGLWDRKRTIVSRRGMTFTQPTELLADMYGNEGFASFARTYMEGPHAPNVILRVDEIQRQFSGNETDSSGSTGKQLGQFLTWVEDNAVTVTLLLGVPGSSKSWSTRCIAGQYKRPLIHFDLAGMEDKMVGEGGKIQRENERIVEAISDKKIWLIATANSLRGLPPELISRADIFFFDVPSDEEKLGIMKLKIAAYKLNPEQKFPDMTCWTGRDINKCAMKAHQMGCSLTEASKYVLPLLKSNHKEIEALRESAHDRFLSAAHEGIYQFQKLDAPKTVEHTAKVVHGRQFR